VVVRPRVPLVALQELDLLVFPRVQSSAVRLQDLPLLTLRGRLAAGAEVALLLLVQLIEVPHMTA
jgi:hypothetical protein